MKESPLVPLSEGMEDERGLIQPLVDEPMASALLITGRRGTIRGNHTHKTDWHYCYVVSGTMEYHWREAGSSEQPKRVTVRRGQMVFTPPMTEHAFSFLEDTTFIALARNPRDQASYEADTERIELIQAQ